MILKICGITNPADAQAAIAEGANAIGFNFYPPSPRYLTPDRAAAIPTPGALRVGVFVDETPARIEEIARIAALDIAQLHGHETFDDYPTTLTVWKAIRITEAFTFDDYLAAPAEALLLDGSASGETFNWAIAAHPHKHVIIAGGLDATNVAEAIAIANPWGVDACSRIESSKGIKDHKKMKDFLSEAKAAFHARGDA
jgi:phosphoribosylanthranilate isomerase